MRRSVQRIEVEQKHFDFKMPDFTSLDDAKLAAVLNFVVFDLAHAAEGTKPLTAEGRYVLRMKMKDKVINKSFIIVR